MQQYMVRIIDSYTHKDKGDVFIKAMNADTLRKRIIKDILNDDVVLNVYKVNTDKNTFLGSMWSVGEYVTFRVNSPGSRNSDSHPVNRKTGKFIR